MSMSKVTTIYPFSGRLTVFQSDMVAKVKHEVENMRPTDWVLDMADEIIVLMYDEGENPNTLMECRKTIYATAATSLLAYGFWTAFFNSTVRRKKKGYVYAVQDESGMIKIGRSINPETRINCIRTQSGKNISQVYISPSCTNYEAKERALHKKFAQYRQSGEWFNVAMCDVVTAIKESFAEIIGKTLIPSAQLQIK